MPGQHDDRALDALLAHQAAQLAAVHVGQADVEEHEVVVLLLGPRQPVGAGAGLEDVELLGQHQLVGQRLAQVGVVVDHQDFLQRAHGHLRCFDTSLRAVRVAGNDRGVGAHATVSADARLLQSRPRASIRPATPPRKDHDVPRPHPARTARPRPRRPAHGRGDRAGRRGRRRAGARGRDRDRPRGSPICARSGAVDLAHHRAAGRDAEGARLRRRSRPGRACRATPASAGSAPPPTRPPISPGR